jgi:hypothetical protein
VSISPTRGLYRTLAVSLFLTAAMWALLSWPKSPLAPAAGGATFELDTPPSPASR